MPLSPQKLREIVFQLLYSQEVGQPQIEDMIEMMMNELAVSRKNVQLAQARVQQIIDDLPEIDHLINSVSTFYEFNRIQLVTKTILRLGVFELVFDHTIPAKVAIAEAIRLSRKFSSRESASFVNALLDQLYQTHLGLATSSNQLDQSSQFLKASERKLSKIVKEQPQIAVEGYIDDEAH